MVPGEEDGGVGHLVGMSQPTERNVPAKALAFQTWGIVYVSYGEHVILQTGAGGNLYEKWLATSSGMGSHSRAWEAGIWVAI